jgi:LysR family transcriptional activator of nhaA
MEWLNYHHLLYFWMVAREGGLAGAAAKLRLSPPTLSTQIKSLEDSLGEKLFTKRGRRLSLTERGQVAYRYADEIFSLGRELVGAVREGTVDRPMKLTVGVAQSVPKLIVRRLLAPVEKMPGVQLVCVEEPNERLLAELTVHALDVVLSDAPGVATSGVRIYNHLLGETQVAIYGTEKLVAAYREGFPRSLQGAPFLLPTQAASVLRRSLDAWFDELRIQPRVAAEFDDSALLKAFAQDGLGLFAGPAVITPEIQRQYRVRRLGVATGIKERFYAITAERRMRHPALVAVTEAARGRVFRSAPRAEPAG